MKPSRTPKDRGENEAFRDDSVSAFASFMQNVNHPTSVVRVTSKATGAVRWLSVDEFLEDSTAILLHSTVKLFRPGGSQ